MTEAILTLPQESEGGRRLAVLTDQSLDAHRNKTAVALLRFRPQAVVCVVDPGHVGGDLEALLGVGRGIPIVGSADDAIKLGARQLVIGVATPGGVLPSDLRPIVYDAIRHRMSVVSGLHASVDGDPNIASLAARHAVDIVNIRRVPAFQHHIGGARARLLPAFRVLTVGTDANIGKTTTTLLLEEWFKKHKINARFVATGQDGMLVKGRGLCIDRVITDFATGSVERLIEHEARGQSLLLVEGQDALLSPSYSPVSLALLHGVCPDAMVLCHNPGRQVHRHSDVPIPPLPQYIALYEALLAPLHPGKVVAISLNTKDMLPGPAAKVLAQTEKETGLPVVDPIRDPEGLSRLAEAILALARSMGRKVGPAKKKPGKAKRRS